MKRASEHERDQRDLKILQMLDQGIPQPEIAAALGISRGPIVRLVRDIRDDEKGAQCPVN